MKHTNPRDIDRRFCFEVVTPTDRLFFQAENEEILMFWMQVIQNAIAHALNNNLPNAKKSGHPDDAMSSSNSFHVLLAHDEANKYCADCGDESKDHITFIYNFCEY